MKLQRPNPESAPYGVRAMLTVARAAEGGLGPTHRTILAAAQSMILHTDLDIDTLEPIDAQELAAHFRPVELGRQLIQGMVVLSLCDGPASPEQMRTITAYAEAMEVDEPAIRVIQRLAEHELLLFRLDFYRRSHMRHIFESQYRTQGGILGVAKGILGLKGVVTDPALAARFEAFGSLPENTLGHAFYRHYKSNGFAFPGEPAGFPVAGVYHDFSHVLAGYGIEPDGEVQTAAFSAGYRKNEHAFFILLFVVLTFSSGVNMTPVAQPEIRSVLGKGDTAKKMLRAIERGSQMNTDLAEDWDFWPLVELPIDEVRRRLNVPPLVAE
jgi:hypothetical protein